MLRLALDVAQRINFASVQNAVPIIRSISICNSHDVAFDNLTLSLVPQPGFCRAKQWIIDRIPVNGDASITDRALQLDFDFLAGLNEAEHGQLVFTLSKDQETLASEVAPVRLLARDEWGGLDEMAQVLSAFVAPNEAVIAKILKEAGLILEQYGHSPSMDGYQSRDSARRFG